jgi:hypothetical protein
VLVGVTVLLSSTLFTDYSAQCEAMRRYSAAVKVTALCFCGWGWGGGGRLLQLGNVMLRLNICNIFKVELAASPKSSVGAVSVVLGFC